MGIEYWDQWTLVQHIWGALIPVAFKVMGDLCEKYDIQNAACSAYMILLDPNFLYVFRCERPHKGSSENFEITI